MYDWVQFVGLIIIPAIGLLFLILYVRATIEQAEAMQKPCIVLQSALRAREEAILEMSGIPGDLILGPVQGLVALRNIGAGPAVNITYIFEKVSESHGPVRSEGSIPTLSRDDTLPTHTSYGIFPAHKFECTVTYQSLSKRWYQTHLSANNVVLGDFHFRRLYWWTRLRHWYKEREYRRQMAAYKKLA